MGILVGSLKTMSRINLRSFYGRSGSVMKPSKAPPLQQAMEGAN